MLIISKVMLHIFIRKKDMATYVIVHPLPPGYSHLLHLFKSASSAT